MVSEESKHLRKRLGIRASGLRRLRAAYATLYGFEFAIKEANNADMSDVMAALRKLIGEDEG